ncbi:hypothetical protein [Halobacillus sp. BBL2006]|uniref:hypothetical protein n=1 Tax=Halobacillus sp. BBL2006 TaxID=1543706 RepID=UPI0005423F74|nr:hypothetical protein [Halobacillus sp. BBL2006]KHE72761.1 hypothetical protein LD39_02880 [Halobacillus sp. BBL2006]
MNRTAKIYSSLVLILILTACSTSSAKEVQIEQPSFANTLFIQKVEGHESSEERTKMVTDHSKIESILQKVNGLPLEEAASTSLFQTIKSQPTYMFGFSENEKLESGDSMEYGFYILKNGTFIFTHKDINQLRKRPAVSKEKHKELLHDIKGELDITF